MKRDLVDGVVGPRTTEMMDQMISMNGMTNAEKISFLMSRNRELRAENEKLFGIGKKWMSKAAKLESENAKLRKLVSCLVNAEHPLDRATLIANAAYMLAELGFWDGE